MERVVSRGRPSGAPRPSLGGTVHAQEMRVFAFRDLKDLDLATLKGEVLPAIAAAVMSVPQGIAYALIAGLPPAMGLYAGAVPAIVGAFFRSSRTVIVGPTNAISLLIATSVVATAESPIAAAALLALLVGVLQVGAGLLRLDALVDYISTSVVAGYITGAASLILVGQLASLTGTEPVSGDIVARLVGFLRALDRVDPVPLALGTSAIVFIAVMRRFLARGVPSLLAMVLGIGVVYVTGLPVDTVADLAPIPAGLPPLAMPALTGLRELVPVAIAAMVLSLVESSAVSRTLAAQSGQRVDVRQDFTGLGLANVAAGLFGAYPVSGSLSRSALNASLGAKTRVAGMLAGIFVLFVPHTLGFVLDYTPIAVLSGIIVVVAIDLIDREAISSLLHSGPGDRLAFAGTVLGTWFLPLDQAIYLGVGLSIVLFLRRARLLVVRELWVDRDLRLHEVDDRPPPGLTRCSAIRVLHIEGPLFFGAASELERAIARRIDDPDVQVLVVRLKRAQGIDFTTGSVLKRANDALRARNRHLLLVGMRPDMMKRLEDIGVVAAFSEEDLYPTEPGWFVAMNQALGDALALVDTEACSAKHACADCPIARYVNHRETTPRVDR